MDNQMGRESPVYYNQIQRDDLYGMNFKMGSRIIPECGPHYFTTGVVGPFVKLKGSDNMFFLTANHVITQRLVHSRTFVGSQALFLMYGTGKARRCGRVFAGGERSSRAALVKIFDDLVPNRENFLETTGYNFSGVSSINFPTFDNRDAKNMTKVVIFGKRTRTALVKIIADTWKERLYLYTYETGLFKLGEAGSAIFLVDQEMFLHCVGILAGGKEQDPLQFVIIPIEIILEQLAQQIGMPLELATFDS